MPKRMRWAALAAMLLAFEIANAMPAASQTLLQQWLGLGSPASMEQPRLSRPARRLANGDGAAVHQPEASFREDRSVMREGQGGLRTVCVRTCDGYYFPVSFGVTRSRFGRDQASCRQSCGDDARLYVMPRNGSIESAVDLEGRPYTKLPTAFRYRQSLLQGCACRAAPWSEAEARRHDQYALAEQARRAEEDRNRPPMLTAFSSHRSAEELRVDSVEVALTLAETLIELEDQRAATVLAGTYPRNGTGPPPIAEHASMARLQERQPTRADEGTLSHDGEPRRFLGGRAGETASAAATPVWRGGSRHTAQSPRLASQAQPKGLSLFSGLGLGKSQTAYTWPGDPVRR